MEKYEKIEFDMNSIDSVYEKQCLKEWNSFSTKWILRKLQVKRPIFINESLIDVYGDAKINKVKEKIKANKTSDLMESTNFIFCKRLVFGLQHLQ
jgi:hypothetical protein